MNRFHPYVRQPTAGSPAASVAVLPAALQSAIQNSFGGLAQLPSTSTAALAAGGYPITLADLVVASTTGCASSGGFSSSSLSSSLVGGGIGSGQLLDGHYMIMDNSQTMVDHHNDTDTGSEARLNAESDDGSPVQDPGYVAGKMFIGGLSWQTSAEGLRDYFSRFGEVNECMVMRDPATKRARGFGFITFADPSAVDKVLAVAEHDLDGKKIDPKVAFPKRAQTKMVIKTKKVFIGGLSASSTLEDMKAYFEQYGKVEDAMLMFDKTTQRHRGFGFITFDNDDVADKVCEIHFHEINGKMVECKKAQPKEVMLPVQLNKSRAAAARNLYGLAPEQLLAYATYLPRFGYGSMVYPGNIGSALSMPNFYTSPGAATARTGGPAGFDATAALYAGLQSPDSSWQLSNAYPTNMQPMHQQHPYYKV